MQTEKHENGTTFSPQYFIIQKSEPQYKLIKEQLLDSTHHHQSGSSHYFIRTGSDNHCICRIKAGNGTVLFYEILNHLQQGITEEDISEVLVNPHQSCPLPGYFYVTPKIEEKLLVSQNQGYG